MQSHRCISAIDAAIASRRVANGVVSVHESVRHRAVIRHSEVVDALAQAVFVGRRLRRATDVPFEGDLAAFDLVVDPLTRLLLAVEEQVVEEWRDSVLRDGGVGEGVDLELRGAAVEADVAVAAGEGAGEGVAVELDGEWEVEFAVRVVFVIIWWVAEVTWCRRGKDQVGGVGNC